jgi:hypothetical protein
MTVGEKLRNLRLQTKKTLKEESKSFELSCTAPESFG